MLKNIYFICCITAAGSFLYVGNTAASPDSPDCLVSKISGYLSDGSNLLVKSPRTQAYQQEYSQAFLKIYPAFPETHRYAYSVIARFPFNRRCLHVLTVYSPIGAEGMVTTFTHPIDLNNPKSLWDDKISSDEEQPRPWAGFVEDAGKRCLAKQWEHQEQRTAKHRQAFGEEIVPQGSSASVCPSAKKLIVADEKGIRTYDVVLQEEPYDRINKALNKFIEPRDRNKRVRNALYASLAIGCVASASAARSQSK